MKGGRRASVLLGALALYLLAAEAGAAERRAAGGLVLRVDRTRHKVLVSCGEVPGFMAATVMPFTVEDPVELEGISVGTMIDFTLVDEAGSSHIEQVRTHRFASADQQGLEVGRLEVLDRLTSAAPREPGPEIGTLVPDFTLTDQNGRTVSLSSLSGKVVAVSFMYTQCHLPDYCFRLSNNFGLLQKRFADRLGADLVLLTVTFDPENDQPEVLASYGKTWKADAKGWHLLTGQLPEVRRVCRIFGMNVWPDMGMVTHDLHTAVIDRAGRLLANLEGNDFSAQQLGDLLQSAMDASSHAEGCAGQGASRNISYDPDPTGSPEGDGLRSRISRPEARSPRPSSR